MIEEAYVSFELAQLLKERGFDEKCSRWYVANEPQEGIVEKGFGENQFYINAPTQQMAMAWLRTKHIIIVVCPEYFNTDGICSYWGVDIWVGDNYEKLQGDYPSYEEAVETALKYVLEDHYTE